MRDTIDREEWTGINNRSTRKRVPEGFVRDAVNLDPLNGKTMALRAGYERVAAATAARGALAIRSKVVFADGAELKAFDTRTNSLEVLAAIDAAGRLIGTVHNEELFFCTDTELLRYDGSRLRAWGVPKVQAQPVPTLSTGGIPAGNYQIAATFVDAAGDEGPTSIPLLVTLADYAAMTFTLPTPPAGGKVRLYVSPRESSSLFLQFEGTGTAVLSTLRDDTARNDLINLDGPVIADRMIARGGCIYMVSGSTIWNTMPFRPHLVDRAKGFTQYPAQVDVLTATEHGVFVCADRTYYIADGETDDAKQVIPLEYGGVAGSDVLLPDGRVAWMTQYGLAIGSDGGQVQMVSMDAFVPELALSGASGMLDHNGNQLVVSTMQAAAGGNPLAASDYYEAEIVPL